MMLVWGKTKTHAEAIETAGIANLQSSRLRPGVGALWDTTGPGES